MHLKEQWIREGFSSYYVVKKEQKLTYEKEDEVTLEKIYDKVIWRKNPLKRGILGSEENVKGFTVDDLVGYKKEIFSKNNVTLVITGAIDEEKSREIEV